MFKFFLMLLYLHYSLFQICFCFFIGLRFWFSKNKSFVAMPPCVIKKHLVRNLFAIFVEKNLILSTDDILL